MREPQSLTRGVKSRDDDPLGGASSESTVQTSGLRGALASMDYAAADSALRPGGALQLERSPDGDKDATDARPAKGKGARGRLTKKARKDALRYNRRRFRKKKDLWAAIETAVGTSSDGEVDAADVDAVATFQKKAGVRVDGKVGKKTSKAIHAAAPAPVEAATTKHEEAHTAAAPPAPAADAKQAAEAGNAVAAMAAKPASDAKKADSTDADGANATHDFKSEVGDPSAEDHKKINRTELVGGATYKKRDTHDATGALTQRGIVAASRAMRKATPRWDPTWLMTIQQGLGVSTDGGFSTAFIKAIEANQRERRVKLPDGRLDTHGTTAALSAKFGLVAAKAYLDTSAIEPADGEGKKGKKGKRGKKKQPKTAAEMAVTKGGHASSWADWVGRFQTRNFLGQPIRGCVELHKRLMAAEAYLKAKEPGLDVVTLGQKMGADGKRSDYRKPGKRTTSMHSFGIAFDLGIADNPWILGQPPKKKKNGEMNNRAKANKNTAKVLKNASLFMGYGEQLTLEKRGADKAAKMARMGMQLATDEIADRMVATNDALIEYRRMAGDETAIAAKYEMGDAAVKKKSLKWWIKTIKKDNRRLKGSGSNTNWDHSKTKDSGFMTYKKELIVALRDIGGLAWGGCDLSLDSGDMMHWDMRSTGLGADIRSRAHRYKHSSKL